MHTDYERFLQEIQKVSQGDVVEEEEIFVPEERVVGQGLLVPWGGLSDEAWCERWSAVSRPPSLASTRPGAQPTPGSPSSAVSRVEEVARSRARRKEVARVEVRRARRARIRETGELRDEV